MTGLTVLISSLRQWRGEREARTKECAEWLEYLSEREVLTPKEKRTMRYHLDKSRKWADYDALAREWSLRFPQQWLVFRTKRRLLGVL